MPSSIFSSSERVPAGSLTAPWIGAVALAASLLGALEATYRAHGQRPRADDSPGVLALVAERAKSARPDAILLTGSSRMLLDVDAPSLSAALGGREVFQLAQNGISCLPVLEQLVLETRFAGTIICGTEPTSLFGIHERDRERTGEPHLRLPELTWASRFNALAGIYMEERLAILGRDPRTVGRSFLGLRPWPPPGRSAQTLDRVSRVGLATEDTAAADRRWAQLFETGGGRSTTSAELSATTDYLNALVRRFAARGGRVIWVELPSSGRTRAVEERRYPRTQYWEWFAGHVELRGSALSVHDDPALDTFRCPDGSHLDPSDAPAFTRELAGALVRRRLLRD